MKNIIAMIFFLAIFVSVIYLAQYLFYDYLVRFFLIDDKYKYPVVIFLLAMPVLFILSLLLIHYSGNIFLRAVYYLSGIWHGVLVHFLIIIILTWFLVGILKLFSIKLDEAQVLIFAYVGIFLATSMSLYSIYNMNQIMTRSINIDKMSVPDAWRGRTALQISDVHLGSILRSSHMDKINKTISKISPDIIFITGDLFDSIKGNIDYYKDSLKNLDAPLGVYMVSGNHETYLGTELVKKTLQGTNIKYLENELVEIEGLQILGVSYPERNEQKNVAENIEKMDSYDRSSPSILLFHEPVQMSSIAETGVDLMLAGHTHRGQLWPFNYITETIFGDFHFGSYWQGDMYLNTSSGAGVWGPNMRSSGKNELVYFRF